MEAILDDTLRIIDANLNRIGEGLRFLEEIARLRLNDAILTQQLKDMRHKMVRVDEELQRRLLRARDSEGDVGVDMEVPGEEKHREMPDAIVANARRVQESLRVVEEITKVPGLCLDSDSYKQARFDLYTIEKTLLFRVLRQEKIKRLSGLYVIIDTQALRERSHIEVASLAIRGGAKVIQLRDKMHRKRELLSIAQELRALCVEKDVLFIMNDYLDVALATDADGLHVGQDDLPVKVARRLLPSDKILGCSVRTIDKATIAQADGADYIAVGAMYPTPSKETAEVVGTERLEQMRQAVNLPIVAIGGISKDNVNEVLAAGADAIAVISAVMGDEDVEGATRQMVEIIQGERLE
jgi:thiamine-phosphate pyrophosphorylase